MEPDEVGAVIEVGKDAIEVGHFINDNYAQEKIDELHLGSGPGGQMYLDATNRIDEGIHQVEEEARHLADEAIHKGEDVAHQIAEDVHRADDALHHFVDTAENYVDDYSHHHG